MPTEHFIHESTVKFIQFVKKVVLKNVKKIYLAYVLYKVMEVYDKIACTFK